MKIPAGQYAVQIAFGADPAKLDGLIARTLQEVDNFKASPPTSQEVNDIVEAFVRDYETNIKTNSYLADAILNRYKYNEDVESLMTLETVYRSLTPAVIQDAAKTYLNPQSMVKVTLVPEK